MIIANPGTGPINGATKADADHNIVEFISATGLCGWRHEESLDGDGRFGYTVWGVDNADGAFEILMPGLPIEQVRDENALRAPRLYVDGSSWWWGFAVDIVRQKHEHDGDEWV